MKTHRTLFTLFFLTIFAIGVNDSASSSVFAGSDPVAQAYVSKTEIQWQPKTSYSQIVLTVSTPNGTVLRMEFAAGANAAFSSRNEKGITRANGHYIYELRVIPNFSPSLRQTLVAARESGNDKDVEIDLRAKGILPQQDLVQSGAFMILDGAILMGGKNEDGSTGLTGSAESTKSTYSMVSAKMLPRPIRNSFQTLTTRPVSALRPAANSSALFNRYSAHLKSAAFTGGTTIPFDQVIPDDLIVQSSGCFGFDCVNNESFGFDTIRLKENNLQIHFDDTSTSAGFPANDWRIVANDSASGGASKFSIADATASRTPFTITAGAPDNSIFVDSIGRMGLRTATPVLDIHTNTSNTPAIRLEQNNAGGFAAQTWDIGANEANFFIRDTTGGSKLSFRIVPGAPTNSLAIKADGKVGVGTFSPESRLHVFGNLTVEGSLDLRDGSFPFRATTPQIINNQAILDKLLRVSVVNWTGEGENEGLHMTPNLSELKSAFGIGNQTKTSVMDVMGINMAAIKAVYAVVQQKDAEIQTLKQQNADLQKQLASIETRLKALESAATKR
jgi:hypothetical protein